MNELGSFLVSVFHMMATKGARYCSFVNCCTNTKTTIDPRTGTRPKFHKFPNPKKDKERCLEWIKNSRREDLNLKNVKQRLVCGLHFNPCDYNCPADIATSSLLPRAVPAIINLPLPLKTSASKRQSLCPRDLSEVKRQKLEPVSSSTSESSTFPLEDGPATTIPTSMYQALLARISSLEKELKVEKNYQKRLATDLCAARITCQRLKQENKRLTTKIFQLEKPHVITLQVVPMESDK